MTTFRWYDNSKSIFTLFDYRSHSISSQTATAMALQFDPSSNYGFNGDFMPFRVVFSISGGTLYRDESTGQSHYASGTITRVTYYSFDGTKLAEVAGLSVNASTAETIFEVRSASIAPLYFWDFLYANTSTGASFVGSNATGETSFPWQPVLPEVERGDDIFTTFGNDTVRAGAGSDAIYDRGGADLYDGQTGPLDYVSYYSSRFPVTSTHGVVADLIAGTVVGPDDKQDTLISIEGIRGSIHADTLRGSNSANFFAPQAGADYIDGRGGFDTISYDWNRHGGIKAILAVGKIRDEDGSIDRILSIERVVGSLYDDRFYDTTGGQRFDGYAGRDYFSLSAGNDTVSGGTEGDLFVFVGTSFGTDTITDFSTADADRIRLTGISSFSSLVLTDVGNDLEIRAGSSKIILKGGASLTLDAGDFLFG